MRISLTHKFAFLCMPKTASTSIEEALNPYSELLTKSRGLGTALKHTNYRKYNRFIRPYLNSFTQEKIETVCVMREPVDWLFSWYRYRKREEVRGKRQSTYGMDFSDFAALYIQGKAKVGKQSNFLKNSKGEVGVDRVFRYERLDLLQKYFEEKIGKNIEFPLKNISPKEELNLSSDMMEKLKEYLKDDYMIYENLK